MRTLEEVAGRALTWQEPFCGTRQSELRAGDEVVATLRWKSALGSCAIAETAGGAWTLERRGIFNPTIAVRKTDSTIEVATMERRWNGCGTLQGPGGRRYQWSKPSFWGGEWNFTDDAGRVVMRFRPRVLKSSAPITIEAAGASAQDVPLLLVVGWYLIVSMARDGAVAAASG